MRDLTVYDSNKGRSENGTDFNFRQLTSDHDKATSAQIQAHSAAAYELSHIISDENFIYISSRLSVGGDYKETAGTLGAIMYNQDGEPSNMVIFPPNNGQEFLFDTRYKRDIDTFTGGHGDTWLAAETMEAVRHLYLAINGRLDKYTIIFPWQPAQFDAMVKAHAKKRKITVFCTAKEWDGLAKTFDGHNVRLVQPINHLPDMVEDQSLEQIIKDSNTKVKELDTTGWEEFRPLEPDNDMPTNEYPIEAWRGILKDAVIAIAYYARVPTALAGQCVLGAMSILGQRFINAPDVDSHAPASLFLLTQADSGDGKSRANNFSHKAIELWQDRAYSRYLQLYSEWENERDQQPNKKERDLFLANTPAPTNPTTVLDEATIESIVEMFVIDGLTDLSWTADEAAIFFNGHTMKSDTAVNALATLTKLYDGSTVKRRRSKSNRSATHKTQAGNVRLTLDMQGQPVVLMPVLSDPIMRGQGFLARCLIACPESLQGKRDWNSLERLTSNPKSDPRLISYWQRCNELLDPAPNALPMGQPVEGSKLYDNVGRYNMPFEDFDAKKALADYRQAIESQLGKGQALEQLRPFANRLAQNASRVAALTAFFEGRKTVTADDIKRASLLTNYSIGEHIRFLNAKSEESQYSDQLLQWLIKKYKAKGVSVMPYSMVQAGVTVKDLKGKNNKANFELALQVLHDNGNVRITETVNGRYTKREIELKDRFLSK